MAEYTEFKSTPIKEIIFTISYLEDVNIESLKNFCNNSLISEKFSQVSNSFKANLKPVDDGINPPEASIITDGYVLKYITENKSIQAKKGSFAFHKINEYEHFNILIEEALSYWQLFIDNADVKLTVNNISLRYVNFIEINSDESVSQLVNVKPNIPFIQDLKGYLLQVSFKDDEYPEVKINLVSTGTVNKEKKEGIILDIILNKKLDDTQSIGFLLQEFSIMRKIKNDVFFKSITEYTANRYSHE